MPRTIGADFIETESGGIITLPQSFTGSILPQPSGIATVDFDGGNKTAQTVITDLTGILSTSIISCTLRLEATANHTVDDLIVDPIQVMAKNIVAGVGFTIFCTMPVGKGYGLYKVNWTVI
jgi:hypothetical protein